MVRFLGMRHINLQVRDVEASARFYEQAFGMRRFGPAKTDDTVVPLVSPGLRDQITLCGDGAESETDRTPGRPGEHGGIDHFGFVVSPGTRLDDVQQRLEACGATFLARGDIAERVPSLFFADPDGYVFQITRFPRFTRLFIALLPLLNNRTARRERAGRDAARAA